MKISFSIYLFRFYIIPFLDHMVIVEKTVVKALSKHVKHDEFIN